ncbi:MAG: prepilin-type N-terminal cleavage/methylation domain-containing protein, partial [Clostridia bacterium]|nr:prepilin-type N-terminal cleavage/methylation domain-containing protein [Clostridia bacterium]
TKKGFTLVELLATIVIIVIIILIIIYISLHINTK